MGQRTTDRILNRVSVVPTLIPSHGHMIMLCSIQHMTHHVIGLFFFFFFLFFGIVSLLSTTGIGIRHVCYRLNTAEAIDSGHKRKEGNISKSSIQRVLS